MEGETKAEYIARFIKKWEGSKCVCLEGDPGGLTCSGVTIGTYRQHFGQDKTENDLRNMTEKEWIYIFKKSFYWPVKADQIKNWSLALLITDISYMSGAKTTIKKVQKAIGTDADGIVGPKTLHILNEFPEDSFYKIVNMRKKWLEAIVIKNPKQQRFLKGWLNRLNSINYNEKSDN